MLANSNQREGLNYGTLTSDWLISRAHARKWRNFLISGSAALLNTCWSDTLKYLDTILQQI